MNERTREKRNPSFGYAALVMIVCFAFVMIPTILCSEYPRYVFAVLASGLSIVHAAGL